MSKSNTEVNPGPDIWLSGGLPGSRDKPGSQPTVGNSHPPTRPGTAETVVLGEGRAGSGNHITSTSGLLASLDCDFLQDRLRVSLIFVPAPKLVVVKKYLLNQ